MCVCECPVDESLLREGESGKLVTVVKKWITRVLGWILGKGRCLYYSRQAHRQSGTGSVDEP